MPHHPAPLVLPLTQVSTSWTAGFVSGTNEVAGSGSVAGIGSGTGSMVGVTSNSVEGVDSTKDWMVSEVWKE